MVRAVHDVPHLGKERILFQKERGLSPREGVFKTKSVMVRGCPSHFEKYFTTSKVEEILQGRSEKSVTYLKR